jgi:RNA polymerase sigma-70 factor, ECF subfamily
LSSEDELIRRAQAGETEAFCSLARGYERRIYSLAFHYCRERQDAEDLSQEVWLKAYAALATFRFESSFYTWLRRITINCFLNHRRRLLSRARAFPWSNNWPSGWSTPRSMSPGEGVTIEEHASEANVATTSAGWETNVQNRLVVEKVMQALAEVTPQQRLIFLLKHQEGMTYEEIAKELGCSLGTVKKSVSRTVAKLREKLGVNSETESYVSYAAAGILR